MAFRSVVFEMQASEVWRFSYTMSGKNGLEYISCTLTWLPPYNPQEILQSLSGHNFDISKSIDLKF